MADQKITELTELTSGQIADTDVLPIVDVDADATKKWTWASVKADILSWIGAVTATFTNKTIDADNNTITNIGTSELSDEGVTFAKMAHIATNRILGRATAGTGDVEALTATQVRTIINVEDGADATDAANVISALDGAAITVGVVATTDKLLWQDADDSDALKYSTVQSLLDLGSGGAFSEDVGGAYYNGNVSINNTATQTDAALHVKGDGTTSATSSLLIEDSAGTELYDFQDGGVLNLRNGVNIAGYVAAVSGYINIWRKVPEGFGRVGGYFLGSNIRVHGDINDSTYIDLFGVSHATYPNRIRVKGTGGFQMVDGAVLLAAATTSIPSLNMPSGTAPSSPVEGDMWYDGTNLKFRDSSTTRTISWT